MSVVRPHCLSSSGRAEAVPEHHYGEGHLLLLRAAPSVGADLQPTDPAMASGVSDPVWEIEEIVALLDLTAA